MSRPQILWIGIASLSLAMVQGCGNPAGTGPSTNAAAPQRFSQPAAPVKVSRRDIVGYALLDGQLYWPAEAKANILVPNVGTVDQIVAPVGTRVRRGQVLVNLRSKGSATAPASAQSDLSAAKAAYQAAVLQYEGPVQQAKEQLDAARQAESQAKSDPDSSALTAATQARQDAETAFQQAKSQEISNLATSKQQLDQAHIAAKDTLDVQRQGEITSPITGTVLSLNTAVGTIIGGPNASIGEVVNLNAVQIKATYSDDTAKIVHDGDRVVITFSDVPNRIFDGRVSHVRTEPNAQGVTQHVATVSFSNSEGLVKPSSHIKLVGIRIGKVNGALSVPANAIQQDASGKSFVTSDSGQQIQIKAGLSDGEYTEVKSGLSDGQSVRTNP
jgi:multidrug efflux pump subunit AcrA (membrane-fusion protein)